MNSISYIPYADADTDTIDKTFYAMSNLVCTQLTQNLTSIRESNYNVAAIARLLQDYLGLQKFLY